MDCVLGYLAVRAVLLSSHVEVVEDAALGGDALGVGRFVSEPGEGGLAVITDLRANLSDSQLSLELRLLPLAARCPWPDPPVLPGPSLEPSS